MPNEFEIIGTVTKVGPVESFGSNGFRKRAVIIKTRDNEKWPEHVQVELHGDDTDLAPAPGKITVRGWITGRLSPKDGKCWNTLKVKNWEQDKAAPIAAPPVKDPVHEAACARQAVPVAAGGGEDEDRLPF